MDELMQAAAGERPSFSVFSLAPIPLVVHLGYILSDRVPVDVYQYDRRKERQTWVWPDTTDVDLDLAISVHGVPERPLPDCTDVVLRISLSATVPADETVAILGTQPIEIDMVAPDPSVLWLQSKEQVKAFDEVFRGLLASLLGLAPACERLHLFYAGPTPTAIAIGQAINPRMHPAVCLYQYDRRQPLRYEHVVTLS
jgi:hypothetical protein